MKEISTLMNHMPVYTKAGVFVGHVKNAILDLDAGRVEAVMLTRTNPAVVEGGLDVAVPYRWVADYNDIMTLRYFPDHVAAANAAREVEEPETEAFIQVSA